MKGWVNGKCVGWSRQWQIKGLHSCIFCTNSRRSTAMPACNSIVAAIYCSQTMCAATDVCNAVLTLLCRPSTSQQTQMVRQYATSAAANQHSAFMCRYIHLQHPPTHIHQHISFKRSSSHLSVSQSSCMPAIPQGTGSCALHLRCSLQLPSSSHSLFCSFCWISFLEQDSCPCRVLPCAGMVVCVGMAPVSCRTVHVPRQIPSVSSTADAPAVGAGNGAMQQHNPTVKQAAGNHSRKQPLTGSTKQYSMQHADSRQQHANSRRAQRAAGSSTPAGGSHATADSRHSCTCSSTVWLHPGTSQGNSRQSVAAARMQQQCGWGRAGIPEAAQHLCQHSTEQYSPTQVDTQELLRPA